MHEPESDSRRKLRDMVETQIARRGLRDPRLLDALLEIPRDEFLPPETKYLAFEDKAIPIGEDQTISQPYVVALMTDALKLSGSEKVLEIGVGSGYGSAILSRMARTVFGIERRETLLNEAKERLTRLGLTNVKLKCADGNFGWPEEAPFDAISVTAGAVVVPPPLLEQLSEGGRLVIPVGVDPTNQRLIRLTKTNEGTFHREDLGAVAFVPFVGSETWSHFN
jgi:protein-L-isoaspartate(D-aspartate) O-methyltransferase